MFSKLFADTSVHTFAKDILNIIVSNIGRFRYISAITYRSDINLIILTDIVSNISYIIEIA